MICVSDPGPVSLELFYEAEVKAAIDGLKKIPLYNQVLKLDKQPAQQEEEEDEPVAQSATKKSKGASHAYDPETAAQKLVKLATIQQKHIEGPAPKRFPDLAKEDSSANQLYGLQNMEELSRLVLYFASKGLEVKAVQTRGSCLFTAIRRCLDCPKEYTNCHLRRQIVMFVVSNVEFLYPLLQLHITGNYGHLRLTQAEYDLKKVQGIFTQDEITEFNEPGPFSLVSYLEALLGLSFYGEEV